jgi:dTDP-4-amino-4,6-dideoxygalactose transaminase
MTPAAALLGGTPTRTADYPPWPQWDDTERAGLIATLDSGGWWQGDGDRCQAFADDFAAFQGARHGLALTNGTHTLETALVACGVGEGDEVIVPAITFVASATAILAVNATPVIVDVDPDTLCLDPAAAEAAITDRTRAIMVVHCGGCVADLDALCALVERRGLHLIEDCAHAHGSTWRGRGVGSWGSFGSFSMQASKLMTAGEGGALITNAAALEDLAWQYANCGRERERWFYHHRTAGSNLRMTEWQGAVLAAQLARFPEQNRTRNANAVLLGEALAAIPGIRPQPRDPRMGSNGNYCFIFHYDAAAFAGLPLLDFEQALAAEGIPMGVSYPSLAALELFAERNFGPRLRASAPAVRYDRAALPNAERAVAATVWIQHRILLANADDVLDVARAVERIHANAGALRSASATQA